MEQDLFLWCKLQPQNSAAAAAAAKIAEAEVAEAAAMDISYVRTAVVS